jgi:hypothetical protein
LATTRKGRTILVSKLFNGSELPSYLWKDKRNLLFNIWKNRVTLKLKIGKLEELKFNHHFQETSCSVSAAMLNFCSHSTPKNGLIQVFRIISLLDLELYDFFYFFYGFISEVVG